MRLYNRFGHHDALLFQTQRVQAGNVEPLNQADEAVGVLRVGGIAVGLERTRPSRIIQNVQRKQIGIALACGQKK